MNRSFITIIIFCVSLGCLLGFLIKLYIVDDQSQRSIKVSTSYASDKADSFSLKSKKIIFLHHSTGNRIWKGGVAEWFAKYNFRHNTKYIITERSFPKKSPYGWTNYPYDYWNIWVKNEGGTEFKGEPTLELLTKKYDVIIFKHCYPVSNIKKDRGIPDISSKSKRIENYKLQYEALKVKLREFPNNIFILLTGAALVKDKTKVENAERARIFFSWVKEEWDEAGDNIYLWDFYTLETEGGLYLKNNYAEGKRDSHPSKGFAKRVAPLFSKRIVNIIEGKGDITSLTGVVNN